MPDFRLSLSALTLLVGVRKSIRPVKLSDGVRVGVVICLERGSDCLHMVQLMPLHPQPHNFFPHLNPDWFLPFWYRLTQVVLEKRPLNGCGVVVVVVVSTYSQWLKW